VPKFSEQESRVAVDLTPDGEGCELVLIAGEAPADDAAKFEAGWSTILEGLAVRLGEGKEEEE
jgi:hypothetical protein